MNNNEQREFMVRKGSRVRVPVSAPAPIQVLPCRPTVNGVTLFRGFMYFIYILKSQKTNKYYIGYTENIIQRLKNHNSGIVKSTKNGVPWNVVYREKFVTKKEAYKRERVIKSYKGGRAFKSLIEK